MCGDFNARTGRIADYVDIDCGDSQYVSFYSECLDKANNRCSMDQVVHKVGRRLVDLCFNNNLLIRNGRTLGDLEGKYTCHIQQGSSVVDYFICSEILTKDIVEMKVEDLNQFSDHCPL